MTCFLTCMFTLLQICLVLSKAMLFPPKNLTVGLLDFKATAEWLPGQGNPPGTKYTLEFITAKNMFGGKWIRSPHCTDLTILKCEMTFDRQPDELFWNYFVRVKTTFVGTSSNWTTTSRSFQPYGDTRLSSPDVNISTDQKSIHINFSHCLDLKPGIKPLEFLLYLSEKSAEGESKLAGPISTSESPYTFTDVPSGKNYCVSVSASHQGASKNNNFNTTKCVFLLDSNRSVVLILCIAAILLITFSTGIVLTLGCFWDMRLISMKRRIPDALIIFPGYNWVLKLTPEKFQTIRRTWQKKITEDWDSSPDDESNDGSQFYHPRENLTNVIINPSSIANVNPPEQAEAAETSNQCYRNTLDTDLEPSEESEISEKEDDDLYPVASVSLCTCTSNHSETSIFLQAITVSKLANSETDSYCAEETPCSSGSDCEREVPAEEKDDEVSLLGDYYSESASYEPRHDIKY